MIVAGIAIAGLILSVISLVLAGFAFVELKSFNKSTHNIQYVPTSGGVDYDEHGFEILTDKIKEKLQDDDLEN